MVTGPMSACIATLTGMGWQTKFPEVWIDPAGQTWSIGSADVSRADISQIIQSIIVGTLWKKAAAGWQGKGLEQGFDKAPLSVHTQLNKANKLSEAGMLEA